MAHRKKIPIEKLAETVNEIFEEYGTTIKQDLDVIGQKMGQAGAEALRKESRAKFHSKKYKYAKGWKTQSEKHNIYTKTTIYNKHPGFPHLLEHSHVVRNGTRRVVGKYSGRPHIAPIAEKLTDAYEKEVISKL